MGHKMLGKSTGASYSLGRITPASHLIFISGTVARDDQGNIVAPGNMKVQARRVFERIGQLLEEAGASLDNVVKLTSFVTDLEQYEEFAVVRTEVFRNCPYPTSSTVQVKRFLSEGVVLEVEAIAAL